MVLAVSPSTGAVIGLRPILARGPSLEALRCGSYGNDSKWFAILSNLGLAYRTFRIYRFAKQYPECPSHVLSAMVTRGMEAFGRFCFVDTTRAVFELLDETRLLVTCAYHVFCGASVGYEMGFRWYYQTNYDSDFKKEYLQHLGVQPYPLNGSTFQDVCETTSSTETSQSVSADTEETLVFTRGLSQELVNNREAMNNGSAALDLMQSASPEVRDEWVEYGLSQLFEISETAKSLRADTGFGINHSDADERFETLLQSVFNLVWNSGTKHEGVEHPGALYYSYGTRMLEEVSGVLNKIDYSISDDPGGSSSHIEKWSILATVGSEVSEPRQWQVP